jgi:hypothetical protein
VLDVLEDKIKHGSVYLSNLVKEWVIAKELNVYCKRIKEKRHVHKLASSYMENNHGDNHIYLKVDLNNVLELYNM